MFKNKKNIHRLKILSILFAGSLIFIIPFMYMNLQIHGDYKFQLNRFYGLHSYFKSPVNFETFHHYGKAVHLFYPPITMFPFSVFNFLTHRFELSLKLFALLITFLSMVITYYSVNKITFNSKVAILCSFLYVFSTYNMASIYARLAVGEWISYMLLPLLYLGIHELFFSKKCRWTLIPITLYFISNTHIISTFLGFVFVALAGIFALVTNFKKVILNIKPIMLSAVSSILVVIGSILPIFEQTSFTPLHMAKVWNVEKNTYTIDKWFMNLFSANMFDVSITFVFFGLVIYCFAMFKKLRGYERFFMFVVVICMILQLRVGAWNILNATPLRNIQFTFRLNTYIIWLTTMVFGSVFSRSGFKRSTENKTIFTLYFLIFCTFVSSLAFFYTLCYKQSHEIADFEALKNKVLITRNRDYTGEKQFKHSWNLINRTYLLNGKKVVLQPSYDATNMYVDVTTKKSRSTLDIPITLYKGINILDNNKSLDVKLSKKGYPQIVLNGKGIHKLHIWFKWTIFTRICQLISLLSFVTILFKDYIVKVIKSILKK